ncbi:MAG: DUF3048 domain-containing protein [Candidatus Magasanikbacteria bacterium]
MKKKKIKLRKILPLGLIMWWIKIKKKSKKYFPDEVEIIYILTGIIFITALGLILWFGYTYFLNKRFASMSILGFGSDLITKDGVVEDCELRRLLDGVCVESKEEVNPRLIAVMIENHTDARPQSGLVDASIVYEAPVEANYTRFLAIYPADIEVEKAGPVRSARPYYLDWVSEYGDPMYMHVGGSNEALSLIKQYDIFDINEMTKGWYFWRSEDRYAPHNTYTSSEFWDKVLTDYDSRQPIAESQAGWWTFVTSSPDHFITTSPTNTENLVDEITVSFLPPVYEARWEFNSSTGKYDRFQMEGTHRDQDGRKIKADTIIVQHVSSQVLDEVGRIAIDTIGEGDVEVFYDGLVFIGTWKKEDRTSRTRFYSARGGSASGGNEVGEEIKLKPGKIWIEVVNGRGSVEYSTQL